MHIAIFLQHYHTPDCPTAARPYALVQALSARHRVTLIATDTWHARRITNDFDWVPPGVEAHWLHVPYANAMGTWRRLGSYLQYSLQALLESRRIDPPDGIFASSTPLTTGLVAARAARYWNVPWVFEVRDLWPDFPIQMGAVPFRPLHSLLYRLERWLYRDAAHVVAASPDQATHICRTVPPEAVSTVEYGTEIEAVDTISSADIAALRAAYDLGERTIVLYAGTFGRANAIPTLLRTINHLKNRDDVCFVFMGHGYYAPRLRQTAQAVSALRVVPPQPRQRALALFQLADLSLVPFINRPVLATNSPSKLYDSLAAGTPVVVTNPGWTKSLVEAHRCGWYVPAERPHRLAARIATLLNAPAQLRHAGLRGAALARHRFRRSDHMDRLVSVVESALETDRAAAKR